MKRLICTIALLAAFICLLPATALAAPGAVVNLTTSTTQTSITLTWQAASGATSYRARLWPGTSTTTTASTKQLTYTFGSLKCDTSYAVSATGYDGALGPPTVALATTKACDPPPDPTPPPASGTEPAPIAGQGYHEAFRDDFTTLNRFVWDDHIWYDSPPCTGTVTQDCPNGENWAGFQETDSTGTLHLRTSRNYIWHNGSQSGGYPINTMTTQTSGKTFQYGYFEARMKWPAGHGSWPGFWLYSYQHAIDSDQCTTQAGEIDVMEGQGSERNVFYGTVHSNTNGCQPWDDQNGNNWQDTGVDLTTGFHTYGVKWTPTTVTWYLDGKQTHSAPTYATDNQPMFLLVQEWVGGWTYDTDSTTPDVLDNQIDYVDVWQQ